MEGLSDSCSHLLILHPMNKAVFTSIQDTMANMNTTKDLKRRSEIDVWRAANGKLYMQRQEIACTRDGARSDDRRDCFGLRSACPSNPFQFFTVCPFVLSLSFELQNLNPIPNELFDPILVYSPFVDRRSFRVRYQTHSFVSTNASMQLIRKQVATCSQNVSLNLIIIPVIAP